MQFKTLIVDDEPLARMRMRKLLEPYADLVEIVGEASTGEEAVTKIRELHPDVLFLDIQKLDKSVTSIDTTVFWAEYKVDFDEKSKQPLRKIRLTTF